MICIFCIKAADAQTAFVKKLDSPRIVEETDIKQYPDLAHPDDCLCDCQHSPVGTVKFQ